MHRARLYIANSFFKEAQEDCSLLLRRDPKNIEALMIRATIAFKQKQLNKGEMEKQFELAEKDLKECDKMSRKDYAIQALFGELWVQKNDMTKGLEYFNLSVMYFQSLPAYIQEAKKADLYGILLQRAEVYRSKNAGADALADYTKAIELFPDRPEAYQLRRDFYNACGEKEKASADDAELKKIASNHQ